MIKKIIIDIFLKLRKLKYYLFSNNRNVIGVFKAFQPVVLRGEGKIEFGENVKIGVINSPNFYNGYAYIEARKKQSKIIFKNNININNCFSVTAEKSIEIGNHVLIGNNCKILDSNFHDLHPQRRHDSDPNPESVVIKDNVFIGDNVTILKGVVVEENTVIGSGSVVTKSFKGNLIIAGVPAEIIGEI